MARSAYIISVAPDAVEGGRIIQGSTAADRAQAVYAPSDNGLNADHLVGTLDAFLKEFPEGRKTADLLLPTDAVIFRRLQFGFGDIKKIRQVLPQQLENELLEELSLYAYDFEVVHSDEHHGEVMVYLVDKPLVQRLVDTAEQHQVFLRKVSFSAHALAGLAGREGAHQCLVYAGSDESYIAEVHSGHLIEVGRLSARPGRVLSSQEAAKAQDAKAVLDGIVADASGGGGAMAALTAELEKLRDEANRFIRIRSGSSEMEVLIFGLFDRFFDVSPGSKELSLQSPEAMQEGSGERPFAGILHLVYAQADHALSFLKLNFFHRVGVWRHILSELKAPLVASVALFLATVLLIGVGFFLRAGALQERLRAVDDDLKKRLNISGKINTFVVRSALNEKEKQLNDLKKSREATAYMERYHYDALFLLKDLSELVSKHADLTVDSLSFNRNRFSISGTAKSYNATEVLKNRLAAMERFQGQDVKLINSGASPAIRYRISVER